MPERIGRFKVEGHLGSGGFATVWLARDERLDSLVAVKILAENLSHDVEVRARFIKEARILRGIRSNRVVSLYEIAELDDGRPYFVMEYANKGTLEKFLHTSQSTGQALSVVDAVAVTRQIASCLGDIHKAGIAHRDLKPANILLTSHSPTNMVSDRATGADEVLSKIGEMILGDFGIARLLDDPKKSTMLGGTPDYMAPEQVNPAMVKEVNERCDIYAGSVILYELLTGSTPWSDLALAEVLSQKAQGRVPSVTTVREDVPQSLGKVLERGLASDPDDRYQSVTEWDEALSSALPTNAPGPEPGSTIRRIGDLYNEMMWKKVGEDQKVRSLKDPRRRPAERVPTQPATGPRVNKKKPSPGTPPIRKEPDDVREEPDASSQEPSPRRTRRMLILGVLLLVLAGSGALTVFFIRAISDHFASGEANFNVSGSINESFTLGLEDSGISPSTLERLDFDEDIGSLQDPDLTIEFATEPTSVGEVEDFRIFFSAPRSILRKDRLFSSTEDCSVDLRTLSYDEIEGTLACVLSNDFGNGKGGDQITIKGNFNALK